MHTDCIKEAAPNQLTHVNTKIMNPFLSLCTCKSILAKIQVDVSSW